MEAEALTRILSFTNKGSFQRVLSSGLRPRHFSYGKDEYEYIIQFYNKYGKIPEVKTFRKEFPQFNPERSIEPTKFLFDGVKAGFAMRMLQEVNDSISSGIEEDNPDIKKLLKTVNSTLRDINISASTTQMVSYEDTLDERKKGYQKRKNSDHLGILTPWDTINDLMLGFVDGQFCVILGRPWAGKTWVMMNCVVQAYIDGYNVLLVTKEMSCDEMARRADAIIFKLPYKGLRSGALEATVEGTYMAANFNGEEGKLTIAGDDVDGTGGLIALREQIVQVDPDIVFVDGAYLLEDDLDAKNTVEKLKNISRGFKKLARERNIPIVISVQQGRGGSRKTGGDLDSVQWSDAFSQDGDFAIEVFGEVKTPIRTLKILKQREGDSGEVKINFHSRDKIDFSELGSMQAVADSQKVTGDKKFHFE